MAYLGLSARAYDRNPSLVSMVVHVGIELSGCAIWYMVTG